jgi:hypothetical protein
MSGKQSGIGARFLCGGYDISGDINALDSMHADQALNDSTDITQEAHSRLPTLRDGAMSFTSFFDAANAHPVLSALPTADELMTFLVPPLAIGSPACNLNAKQIDYPPARASDAGLTMKVEGQGQGYGLEWGLQLTPGLRTDTAATNGSSLNNGAATAYGAQAYLQVTAFTGTSVTVTIQHAPDGSTWTSLLAFTAVTAAPATQRVATLSGPFTATDASPAVFTLSDGGSLANGTMVALSAPPSPQVLPGGFTAGTTYYVVSASGSTFELSASSGGSAIDSTSAGAGWVSQVVQQYLRAVTTGTFSSATFAALVNRNGALTEFAG